MTALKRAAALTGWRGRFLDMAVGLAAILGHAPFHIWPVTLLCFAYLMRRIDFARAENISGFGRGFAFGLGYFMACTFWIGSAFIVRGPEFIPAMPPMILALAALLAVFWGLAGKIYTRFAGTGTLRWLFLAGCLMLAEFARGHVFGGLPWNLPGYIFKAGGLMSDTASYLGIYGLSFIIFVLSTALAAWSESRKYRLPALAVLTLLPLLSGLGFVRHTNFDAQDKAYNKDALIRVVQVPFSQKDKFERETSINIVNDFIYQSMKPGIEDVTHLVWPEGAIIGLALENEPLLTAMGNILTETDDTPPYWLINSLREITKPNRKGVTKDYYYNTSAIIQYAPDGSYELAGFNDKRRLVPFGEFFPGGEFIEDLGSMILSTSLGSITAADEKTLADFPGLPKVSPQLCYEIIFSRLTPRPKDGQRAEWILNQSNDAWYGKSVGPAQHANIAAYRAIEEGIPIVRSASNGVSGLIDSKGRYVQSLAPSESGIIDIRLPRANSSAGLHKHHNYWLFLILLSITATCVFVRRDARI